MLRDFQASLSAARASPDSARADDSAVVKDLILEEQQRCLRNGELEEIWPAELVCYVKSEGDGRDVYICVSTTTLSPRANPFSISDRHSCVATSKEADTPNGRPSLPAVTRRLLVGPGSD